MVIETELDNDPMLLTHIENMIQKPCFSQSSRVVPESCILPFNSKAPNRHPDPDEITAHSRKFG